MIIGEGPSARRSTERRATSTSGGPQVPAAPEPAIRDECSLDASRPRLGKPPSTFIETVAPNAAPPSAADAPSADGASAVRRPVPPEPPSFPADGASAVRRPVPPEPPSFPADEGAHPGVKTEWWYVNGHLQDANGKRYGFHDALFDTPDVVWGRYNVDLPGMPGATQLDTAFLDVDGGTHVQNRILHLHRPGADHPGLAEGKLENSFTSGMGEWRLERKDARTIELHKPLPDGSMDLVLREDKPPLMMGGAGEIPMGPKGLSKYYTMSQLKAEGTITRNGAATPVEGSVWMDHQWGDMSMFDPWRGWDWFGIQLEGGRQLNAFRFRDDDGESIQTTMGISNPDGSQEHLDDFKVTGGEYWTSPVTGASYPLEWKIEIPSRGAALFIKPLLKEQEVPGSWPYTDKHLNAIPTYWEGDCEVSGIYDGKPVKGRAYMELVGYEKESGTSEDAVAELKRREEAAAAPPPPQEMLIAESPR